MKPDSLTKFSLTIIAALVLAACGSSGSGDKVVAPTTGATATTPSTTVTQPAANQADAAAKKAQAEAEAAKAAAEKAKAEAEKARADADAAKAKAEAEKAKAGNESDAAKQAQAEAEAAKAEADAAKAEAEAAKAEADAAKAEAAAAKEKLEAEEAARKQAEADAAKAKAEAAKAEADAKAKAEAEAKANAIAQENSDRQAANAKLRETPTTSALLDQSSVGAKVVSKRDSNVNTNTSLTQDSTSNDAELMNVQKPDDKLSNLVVGQSTDKKYTLYLDKLKGLSKETPEKNFGIVNLSEDNTNYKITLNTPQVGGVREDDKQGIYTVQEGRANYTSNYKGKPYYKVDEADTKNDTRNYIGFGLVGELYGAKSNNGTTKDFSTGRDTNAPFTHKPYVNVQYGSLTSGLSGVDIKDLAGGIKVEGNIETKVAPYGYTGAAGTEDNYFYRLNEGNMNAADLALLKQQHPKGVLSYAGHAVTYGIDNNWNPKAAANNTAATTNKAPHVPTAIPSGSPVAPPPAVDEKPLLMSGTHVYATIDLDTNDVKGNLYNTWTDQDSTLGYKNVRLVDFKGTISDIGNIAGTATNNVDGSKGLFGASLNQDGSEMGGIIASEKHEPAEKWGAVFGAQLFDVDSIPTFKPASTSNVQTNGNTNTSGNATNKP